MASVGPELQVRIAGTLPSSAHRAAWDPCDDSFLMQAGSDPDLLWVAVYCVPRGTYFFKVTCNGVWEMNYGRGGVLNGENIACCVNEDVTRIRISFHVRNHEVSVFQDPWWTPCSLTQQTEYASRSRLASSSLLDYFRGKPTLLLRIFSFLDVCSLCRVACVSGEIRAIANSDSLWRPLALRFFPELRHRIDDVDWKLAFMRKAMEPTTTLGDLVLGHAELRHCDWYTCPEGHWYAIGECRLPMVSPARTGQQAPAHVCRRYLSARLAGAALAARTTPRCPATSASLPTSWREHCRAPPRSIDSPCLRQHFPEQ